MVAVNESKIFKHQISDKCIVSLFIIESIYENRPTMILACLFLFTGMALAQTAVTGTVVSADDGQPVVGASGKVLALMAEPLRT